jgi:hypothetical protein
LLLSTLGCVYFYVMGSLGWLVIHHVIRLGVVEECETSKLINFIICNNKFNCNELSKAFNTTIHCVCVCVCVYVCMYVYLCIEREDTFRSQLL